MTRRERIIADIKARPNVDWKDVEVRYLRGLVEDIREENRNLKLVVDQYKDRHGELEDEPSHEPRAAK